MSENLWTIVWIAGGLLLLAAGRKLYWLFVAIVGFAAGFMLAGMFVKTDAEWIKWLIAIGIGVLGGMLAVGLQKIAVGAAGFLAGGYGLVYFLETINVNIGDITWPFFVAGGIVGAVLVLAMFEFALILLSSVAGATMVSQTFTFTGWLVTAAFLGLVLVGILIQWAAMRTENKTIKVKSSS
jgi:hypothetical protein